MATFRQWLTAQEPREDAVGYFAKYWRELPEKPKLSAPASFERHMQQRGLFEQVPGLADGWQTVLTEYRQLSAAENAERQGLTVVRPDSHQQAVPVPDERGLADMPAPERMRRVLPTDWPNAVTAELIAINAKLDLILAYLGLAQPHQVAGLHVEYRPGAMPVQSWSADAWQAMWDSADHEAVIE